jgi:conjugative relaxase-like TrwC/TraI family protein
MLSLGTVTAANRDYHQQQIAQGLDDYYAGHGEAPGQWAGQMAAELGLAGQIDGAGHAALVDGQDAGSGEALVERANGSTVLAYDLTFSAPKSVSVLYAVADDETSAALVDAHETAAAAALAHLEREACQVRRGRGGHKHQPADGFLAAAYRHRMSRAQDPQLHTHFVVANAARGSDGRWSGLWGTPLYDHAKSAGYLYQAQLRAEVCERLPWVEWGPVRKGAAEIEGVGPEVRAPFSRRRQEIVEHLAENGRDGRQSAEKAALATRGAKEGSVDTPSWRAEVRARAAEHGLARSELAELTGRAATQREVVDSAALTERLSGPEGLTERHNAFSEREALCEWAAAHGQGAAVTDVEAATADYLANGDVRALAAGDLHTTEDLLDCERQIVDGATRRDGEGAGELDPTSVGASLERHGRPLTAEQATALYAVATSGRGVDGVEALAGTGKTYTAAALATAYRDAGYRVVGTGPTGRAVRELKEQAGIDESFTLTRLAGELTEYGGFDGRRTLVVLDEAGMAGTREAATVFAHAERAGVKIVAIGDSGQLASVQAGGWLGALSRRSESQRLTEVMRQRDPAERRRLAEVHDGQPDRYLLHKLGTKELELHGTTTAAETHALSDWSAAQAPRPWGQATLVARDNATRERLNAGAREWARADGRLGEAMTAGEREFCVGDRIITRRNDRLYDVDNGTRGTVRTVDPDTRELVMESDAGGLHRLPTDYLAAHTEHAYALTGHGMQGGTVEWTGAVGTPEDFTRNWAYTALSRGREPTRLYVAAELPAHAQERAAERAEVAPEAPPEPGPALGRLARAMRRPDDEPLALERLAADEGPALPDGPVTAQTVERAGPDELRAELASLEARLASYPEPLGEQLEEVRADRTRAQGELERAETRLSELARPGEESGSRWWRRRAIDPRPADARAVTVERLRHEQAERDITSANAEERDLAPRVPERRQWEAEHAPLRDRAAELRHRLETGRDRHVERALERPSAEIVEALGERPRDERTRAAWDRGARAIAGYRYEHAPTGQGPLGDERHDRAGARDRQAAGRELERAQHALGRGREQHGHDLGLV